MRIKGEQKECGKQAATKMSQKSKSDALIGLAANRRKNSDEVLASGVEKILTCI